MPIVDSNQARLDMPALLKYSAEETMETPYAGEKQSVEVIISAYIKELSDPQAKFYRYGNTVFIVHGSRKNPGVGMFRGINADTAKNYLQSSFQFVDDAYADGFWLLVTQFRDQSLLNLFRMIKENPPRQGMGYSVKKTQDGQFQVNLTLGPKHEIEGPSMSQEVPLQGMPEPTMPPQGMPPQGMPPQSAPQGMPPQSAPQGALQQIGKPQRTMGGA